MPATGKRRKTHKETAVVRSQGVQDNEAGLLTRIIFWVAKRRIGRVPLGLRVRARDPKLLRNVVRMDIYARFPGHHSGALERARATQGCHDGWLSLLNRHPLCRRQKRRHYRSSTSRPHPIRVQRSL